MPTAGNDSGTLRGRVLWHPRRVTVVLPDGRQYQLGAKPYEQAREVAEKLNLELRILNDRTAGFARQRVIINQRSNHRISGKQSFA